MYWVGDATKVNQWINHKKDVKAYVPCHMKFMEASIQIRFPVRVSA